MLRSLLVSSRALSRSPVAVRAYARTASCASVNSPFPFCCTARLSATGDDALPPPFAPKAEEAGSRNQRQQLRKSDRPFTASPLKFDLSTMAKYGFDVEAMTRKLNTAIDGTDYLRYTLDDLIRTKAPVVSELAANFASHKAFFEGIGPYKTPFPRLRVADYLEKNFGSFANFKLKFKDAAMGVFGSGYVWLCVDDKEVLHIVTCQNAQHPHQIPGLRGLLVLDVWEHAYYAEHRNDRGAFVEKWWNVVNWDYVNSLL